MPKRIGHPSATWGITEGNPIHDDVREIARMVGVHFAIDVTLNREQQITAVFAGELLAEHRAACAYAKEKAMREVPAPFDVVLTSNSGYPLDQNLYQAVKGMSAAAKIVKPRRARSSARPSAVTACRPMDRTALCSRPAPTPTALLAMINATGYRCRINGRFRFRHRSCGTRMCW